MRTTEQMAAIAKKQRRKMRHKAKGQTMPGVITTPAASMISTPDRSVDVTRLYADAVAQMGKRIRLSNAKDPTSRKARRQLNDWKLGTGSQTVSGYWNPEGKRAAK